jgi:hypothetical protein
VRQSGRLARDKHFENPKITAVKGFIGLALGRKVYAATQCPNTINLKKVWVVVGGRGIGDSLQENS